MGTEAITQPKSDEYILSFEVPDEALEQAASVERQAFTWIFCTNKCQYWDWPQ